MAENTVLDPAVDNTPVLRYKFATSLLDGGVFANAIGDAYNSYWLMTLAGKGTPWPENHGVSVNLVTDQTGLSYRNVDLRQGGLTHFRSYAGCIFDYRLMASAAMLGLEYASNQDPSIATATFKARVNEPEPYKTDSTPGFQGRPISGTAWELVVYTRARRQAAANPRWTRLSSRTSS